jgi:hypothetical protein
MSRVVYTQRRFPGRTDGPTTAAAFLADVLAGMVRPTQVFTTIRGGSLDLEYEDPNVVAQPQGGRG